MIELRLKKNHAIMLALQNSYFSDRGKYLQNIWIQYL